MGMRIGGILAGLLGWMALSVSAQAQEVWITPDLPYFEFEVGEEFYLIERDQDNEARIPDAFAKTSRPCPPFCIQPAVVAEGVESVAEIELMDFILDYVETSEGFLIDARLPSFYQTGTIPGAINMPFNMFIPSGDNPFLDQLLALLGGKLQTSGDWDFTDAKNLLLFSNGPWSGQAPMAIHNLLALGYPADRLRYYRGGMQDWVGMGLSVITPQ